MKEKSLPLRWEIMGVVLVTMLAAALRFYRLPELPPGLHFDEGFKGVTARALLNGAPPRLFFESDMGEEPIAIYLVAAALGLVGQKPWIIRLPSAIAGTLTVPLAWWLGRELFRAPLSPGTGRPNAAIRPEWDNLRGQVVGLGTALVLAILYWHLSFSRIGMEPILVPLFATLAFAALARGLAASSAGQPHYHWFGLAGLAIGGSLYTYKAGYFIPILAALFIVYTGIAERGFLRRHGRGLFVAALVALIVAAPIGGYFATHPASFMQRPASVALAGGQNGASGLWQALLDNVPRVLGMFFVRGDANPRSNLPGRPALDMFLAVLFLVGLVRATIGLLRGQRAMALSLLWLGVMVVPTLLADYAPHFGRAIGATPALALLCALGADSVLGMGDAAFIRSRIGNPKPKIALLLALGLMFSGVSTAWAYFHTWSQSPDLFYAYDVGLVQISEQANGLPIGEDVYLTPTARDHYTLQFLVQRPFMSFDGRSGLVFPPPGRPANVIVLLREDETTLPALQQARPDGQITWQIDDSNGHPYADIYHLPASDAPAPRPEYPTAASFGSQIRLCGYDLERITDREVRITLYWQALAPLPQDYTVFVHLLGDTNPETNSSLWAGHDGQPDGGHLATSTWQPGQMILDAHTLSIPAGAPPGTYRLEAGLYLLSTMTRLPAVDGAGQHLADDAALLGTIEVR
jgi:4-amino-4-deoxy-L-arabinose transferase-like glycosyltransferase